MNGFAIKALKKDSNNNEMFTTTSLKKLEWGKRDDDDEKKVGKDPKFHSSSVFSLLVDSTRKSFPLRNNEAKNFLIH